MLPAGANLQATCALGSRPAFTAQRRRRGCAVAAKTKQGDADVRFDGAGWVRQGQSKGGKGDGDIGFKFDGGWRAAGAGQTRAAASQGRGRACKALSRAARCPAMPAGSMQRWVRDDRFAGKSLTTVEPLR